MDTRPALPLRDVELDEALAVAADAARRVGDLLRRGLAHPDRGTKTKSHRHDPVTEYDRQAESILVDTLGGAFPEWGFVSEEGTTRVAGASRRWVVDPLDGTNNFLRRIPHFAVSIALVDGDAPQVACVFDPCRDELFAAVRGRGTSLNGDPVRASRLTVLDGAVVGVGFSTMPDRRATTVRQLPPFLPLVRSLRLLGSAALDLAYVASGRFDATWYLSLHEWDVAAGRLLVTEAGGLVSALSGQPLGDPQRGILASNGPLHVPMLATLRDQGAKT